MIILRLLMGRTVKLFLLLVISYWLLVATPKAFADVTCQPIYGGGQSCFSTQDITLDSKILNPKTNKMVDNLSINDAKYMPGFIITFQISITNNTKGTIGKIYLQNIFPQFINFISGPGNFDINTRILSFDVDYLKPSETRIINIFGKIVDVNQLSFSDNMICLINQVTAVVPDPAAGQDNNQFCIEKIAAPITPAPAITTVKKGFPVFPPQPIISTPATGPESLAFFALIPTGIAGWFLRKYSSKKNV